jgi:uncharacterized protein (TIGR02284 family)
MANTSAIDVLSHLIEINRDVAAALRSAAEGANNSEVETILAQYTTRHSVFVDDLNRELTRLDGDIEERGSLGDALHQSWQAIKASVTGSSAASLLSACEEAERSAEVAYLNAVDAVSTGQPHRLIQKQCEEIKGFRTRLSRLVGEVKDGVEFQKNE